METIRISFEITENDNQEQIKKVLKALGVKSIKTEKTISPTLTKKIEESRTELKEGKTINVDTNNIWESLGLK